MDSSEVLDQQVITELRSVMGENFAHLADSFERDGRARIDAIEQAVADNDAAAVKAQAHSFKGSSGNLGAVKVAELCLSLEQSAGEGDLSGASRTLAELHEAFREACQALEE